MAFFFPRTVYHTETPFSSILRLLNELDEPTPSRRDCPVFQKSVPRQPHFSVGETPDAYVLRGELPGLNKNHVAIDLTEPQKLVIRARYGGTPINSEEKEEVATCDTASESAHSHQATVEDDAEGDGFEVVDDNSKKPQKNAAESQTKPVEQAKQAENDVTEYSRTFKFAYPVDYESMTANIKDGLLTVVVPKPKKTDPRRIIVN
ncbi:hypothetical protein S40285_08824 [Stachybotrys chlorohalonatus IBT 40285]|uniref:SHSP domain-containing protein n=1 Tax=Stachybotrys chlorohalonatus (strain IBT 40285) TaxID=1283841 RepID=A0A084QVR0_STAC4|nr:hypothetical protein S40285_08824 [Stachybotrys chlorohalonata IBT 40285]